ncbi:MAG: CoA transferase, partial [Pseudomonadales bacterium]
MLHGIKVLDLTTGGAGLCGHLLADMGASVQHWFAQSLLGDSVALDAQGQLRDPSLRAWCINQDYAAIDWVAEPQRLHAMLPNVDIVLHDRTDAQLRAADLNPEALLEHYPTLLLVSMTAFGAIGPKSDFAATDLIALAASGHLAVSGAADSAPVRVRTPQAFAHAAADAAVGVLLGLAARQATGLGQRLDVSAAQSTTLATLSRSLDGAVGQPSPQRAAYGTALGGIEVRNQYALADGWALVLPGILPPLAAFMQRLVEWVHADGHCGDWVLTEDWGAAGMKLATGGFEAQQWAELEAGIAAQLAGLTKAEVMAVAVERRLLVAPIMSVADLLASDHARARGLVVQRQGRSRLGPFAHFERSPLPLEATTAVDWQAPVSSAAQASATAAGALPLAGLKVLDLFWVVAGPGATRMLADYGATVVHVETRKRLDMVRNVPPYIDGVAEPERAACHHSTNTNKLNLSLDLSNPESRAVLDDLIRWADVVAESFAPGVAERLGFGREHVRALNPDAIIISSCLMGQDGPWRDYAGYGNTAAAVSGFHALTGYAGQPP